MDVSVILVSYNTKDLTRTCLNSIYKYTKGIEFEVFVVDNNSQDGSADMIEQEFPKVHLIKNPDNKGFGAANNIAIKQSNAKYVFCLNTDTLLLDNSVKKFYDFMEQNQNVGACGGQLLNADGNLAISCGKFPNLADLIFRTFKLNNILPNLYNNRISTFTLRSFNNISPVDYITGADLFIRKSILDKVGIFDEEFFMYYEDTDLCKRIKNSGNKLVIIPDIKIVHHESKSTSDNIKKIKMSKKSEILYFKKHSGKILYNLVKMYNTIKYGEL